MFGYVGLLTALTQGFLVRPLASRFSSERLVANVIPGFALGILLLIQPTDSWWLYVIIPLPTIFQGLYMPNMTAVISNLSDREIQGRMLSINQSLTALSNAIPPLFGGWLFLIGARIPVYVAIAFSFAAWAVFNLFFQRHRKAAE
jgi:DHA1 family tetracycline resistance protein-like MFS transporter